MYFFKKTVLPSFFHCQSNNTPANPISQDNEKIKHKRDWKMKQPGLRGRNTSSWLGSDSESDYKRWRREASLSPGLSAVG